MRGVVIAIACVAACKGDRRAAVQPPLDLRMFYAAHTDAAADGTNNTFFTIHEDYAMFVVFDAARPEVGPAAAQTTNDAATACAGKPDGHAITCVVNSTHAALAHRKQTASMAMVVVRGDQAFVVRAGNAVFVHTRGDAATPADTQRPLLGAADWTLDVQTIALQPYDTLLLMNRDLFHKRPVFELARFIPLRADSNALEASLAAYLDSLKAQAPSPHPHSLVAVKLAPARD